MPELAYTCDPSSLLASSPCVSCLSEKEMLAVLVAILAMTVDKTIPEVMEDSSCFNCMSKKQMLQALVTIFGNELLGENATAQQVIDEMHCLVCVDEHKLLAAILQLICNNWQTIFCSRFQ